MTNQTNNISDEAKKRKDSFALAKQISDYAAIPFAMHREIAGALGPGIVGLAKNKILSQYEDPSSEMPTELITLAQNLGMQERNEQIQSIQSRRTLSDEEKTAQISKLNSKEVKGKTFEAAQLMQMQYLGASSLDDILSEMGVKNSNPEYEGKTIGEMLQSDDEGTKTRAGLAVQSYQKKTIFEKAAAALDDQLKRGIKGTQLEELFFKPEGEVKAIERAVPADEKARKKK